LLDAPPNVVALLFADEALFALFVLAGLASTLLTMTWFKVNFFRLNPLQIITRSVTKAPNYAFT